MSFPIDWYDPAVDATVAAALDAAATELAIDVVARDRAGSNPTHEAAVLKRTRLTDVSLRAFRDGTPDAAALARRWVEALIAVRRLARTDFSAATLLGYHVMTLWRVESSGNAAAFDQAVRATLGGKAIWGGANNPKGPTCSATRVEGGYRIDGRKTFATGSQSADFLVIGERHEDQDGTARRLRFILPAATPGLSHGDDWTGFGARRTASGSLHLSDVFVPDACVFIAAPALSLEQEAAASGSLSYQILFVNMLVGAAQGAVEAALRLAEPRIRTGLSSAASEALGTIVAHISGAAVLADAAVLSWAALAGERTGALMDNAARRNHARTINAAKVIADRVALDAASRVLEITGAHGTGVDAGLDRFWRDIRVYTLHDPVALRVREIARLLLANTSPDRDAVPYAPAL